MFSFLVVSDVSRTGKNIFYIFCLSILLLVLKQIRTGRNCSVLIFLILVVSQTDRNRRIYTHLVFQKHSNNQII